MSDVKRFRADDALHEAGTRGAEVVLASDYDALAARLAQAERLLRMVWVPDMPEGVARQVRAFLAGSPTDDRSPDLAARLAEVERLRAALKKIAIGSHVASWSFMIARNALEQRTGDMQA